MTSLPAPAFGDPHDRAVDHRRDDAWLRAAWHDPTTRTLVVSGSDVLVEPTSRQPLWLATGDAPAGERYLLGVDDTGRACFAVRSADGVVRGPSEGLRALAATVSGPESGWLCHAVALAQWHATHTHCPRCGTHTEPSSGGAERRCPSDGSAHFPRVDPAMIVLVTDDHDRALLGRQGSWQVGRFSTLAGFVEPGESAEQTVRREVLEEAGVVVDTVHLVASQPWPFPSSLMLGAEARVLGSPEPAPDGDELVEVRWFSRVELSAAVERGEVLVPGRLSISRWLIERWFGTGLPDDGAGWR
jgi:NAD+ diphosphatase